MSQSSTDKRYVRQMVLPQIEPEGQALIAASHVLVVGAGGLGCAALSYLVAAGVGQISIWDADTVSATNLPRQLLYRAEDIGRFKVEAAKTQLQGINPDCLIQVQNRAFTPDADIVVKPQLVLDCSDNFKARFDINQWCFRNQVNLVGAAASQLSGQLWLCHHAQQQSRQGCYQCLFGEGELPVENCLNQGILGPVVGTMGTMQATQALLILAGNKSENQFVQVNWQTLQWQNMHIHQNTQCSLCA
ncbi:HesA/MoeB/ThiF family protein [Planctobacterium marinum]|uniref:HesA/MoeB/ThiF family protein n=1 Tax=Planctobacterium marinum TaxID=1631968 RepID=UPI001E2C5AF6|nr:HesA/MoeB/ThiF family protein [Planctobacterium marinum]MCC2607147.1 HesA/MoeB/ThiF family protein [Planctobacterium marinum]